MPEITPEQIDSPATSGAEDRRHHEADELLGVTASAGPAAGTGDLTGIVPKMAALSGRGAEPREPEVGHGQRSGGARGCVRSRDRRGPAAHLLGRGRRGDVRAAS